MTTERRGGAGGVLLGACLCSLAALLAASTTILAVIAAPAALAGSAAASAVAAPRCGAAAMHVTVTSGIPSMGRFGEVISAANASSAPCSLGGYPFLGAPGVGAPGAVAAVDSFSGAAGVPAAEAPRPEQLELRPGQVASAVLGGPDRTPDGGPVCRTFHGYEVGLPGSSTATAVHGELADCAGLFVGPFVLGFNGTAPSGDVVGAAPPCRGAESSASGPAQFVEVEAWTGSVLAGATTVFASSGSPARYHLVLNPGRYRITSAHQPSRSVIVRAGQRDDLGRFGRCSVMRGAPATIGGSGRPRETTSTTDRLS